MRPYFKPSTITELHVFSKNGVSDTIHGTRLKALHRLIQTKGEPIVTDGDSPINGIRAIEYSTGRHIAMEHRPVGKDFFPCILRTHTLKR